jgi:hypothetical protein
LEFIELRRILKDVKVECVTEARWLAILVSDVSMLLVYLGMLSVLGIPQDLCMADNVLEVMGVTFECLWDAYASGHGP